MTTLASHSACRPTGLPVVSADLPTVRAVEPQPPAAEDIPHMSDEDHLGVELVDQGLWTEGSSRNQNAALIHKGTVAPALQAKLGHFTEPGPLPRHVLNRECASWL